MHWRDTSIIEKLNSPRWPVMANAIKELDCLEAMGITGSERLNIQMNNGQTTYDNKILTHNLCSTQPRNKTITSSVTGPK